MTHPQRIVSVWGMLKVNAAWFVHALNTIGFCEGALEGGAAVGEATTTQAVAKISQLIEHLPAASVPATLASLKLLKSEWVGTGTIPKIRLRGLLENVSQNLQAELEGRSLWLLSAEEQATYGKRSRPFGDAVFEAFPDMREDLEEAAICLAVIDESKEAGDLFIYTAIVTNGERWASTFDKVKNFRKKLKSDHGIYMSKELHAWKFAAGKGEIADHPIYKPERAAIF